VRRHSVFFIVALAMQVWGLWASAHAQEAEIDCKAFVKNADGSWTVVEKVYIPVQKIRVNEGVTFTSDRLFLGEDMVARLNKACPNVQPRPADSDAGAVANASVGVPAGSQTLQTPRIQLSQYADPNGDVDVRRLTCAHLDAASPAEADALLSWYSGWYASAKRRGINLARLRSATLSVRDFCHSNGEKNLGQVMELMLK
jgi:hypothetical protein